MKVLLTIPEKSVSLATAILAQQLEDDEMEIITNKLKENGDNPISVDLTDMANKAALGKKETTQVCLAIAILALSHLNIDGE